MVKSGRTLVPTPLGRLLTAYLTIHFTEYVDVNFTAKVEEQLDDVSGVCRAVGSMHARLPMHVASVCCV